MYDWRIFFLENMSHQPTNVESPPVWGVRFDHSDDSDILQFFTFKKWPLLTHQKDQLKNPDPSWKVATFWGSQKPHHRKKKQVLSSPLRPVLKADFGPRLPLPDQGKCMHNHVTHTTSAEHQNQDHYYYFGEFGWKSLSSWWNRRFSARDVDTLGVYLISTSLFNQILGTYSGDDPFSWSHWC